MSIQSIRQYLSEVEKIIHFGGSKKETAIRNAFYNLLNEYAKQKELMLIPEISVKGRLGKTVTPDGTLKDSLRQDWGYWESKDESDVIDDEIGKKFDKGYPNDNILFEDSQNAVLIQGGREVARVSFDDPEALDRVLKQFVGFERPEVQTFRKAIELFKEDVPKVTEALRILIDKQEKSNKKYLQARNEFHELCKEAINPAITLNDIIEMMIQHILTADIFNTIFDEPHFHRENNIAKELEKVVDTFFTGATRRTALANISHYYKTINAAGAGIADHHEKQKFLKAVYETFYKSYNPKAADRLGVVYTPNEIVKFMIESTDHLLHKHFGKFLEDKGVEILDPASGTGTFICDIIDHIRKEKLEYKYKNELHANEVAILPYYIANLNIEFTYKQKMEQYAEFQNLCFVDTLDNMGFSFKGKQDTLFGVSAENVERIKRQNKKKISVVIGNPPYNAKQENYNNQNANRPYIGIDQRIKDTYVKQGNAQNQIVLYDMFVRFLRWATDRLTDNGIVAFVSNNIFIDGNTFDGFRKIVGDEFSEIYIVNLKGNARTSGEQRRKEGGNVFSDEIRVGVAVYFLIRKQKQDGFTVFYNEIADYAKAEEKKEYLAKNSLDTLQFVRLTPDRKHNWINQTSNNYDELLPLVDKDVKAGRSDKALFKLFSSGLKTQRDEWMYDVTSATLEEKVKYFTHVYEQTRKNPKNKEKMKIKWDHELSKYLSAGIKKKYQPEAIIPCSYRPFIKKHVYFDKHFNGRTYQWLDIYKKGEQNRYVAFSAPGNNKSFHLLSSDGLIDLHFTGDAQCLPLYRFSESGERIENITDWGLQQFQDHYKNTKITKVDIFHYVYAVLHHPAYRKKYEQNLKREFPRVPFYDDFRQWAKWGKALMDLHLNYEQAKKYPVHILEAFLDVTLEEHTAALKPRLKARKESGEIGIDGITTITNVPAEAWEYKLGNRSALEWILDQYKESAPKDPTIREKFNTYHFQDHKEQVIDLLQRVCTVSIETMKIIEQMPKK